MCILDMIFVFVLNTQVKQVAFRETCDNKTTFVDIVHKRELVMVDYDLVSEIHIVKWKEK